MINLHTRKQPGWGCVGIDLDQAYDLSTFDTIAIRVKGRIGGERLQIILRDIDWTEYDLPQSNSYPLPEQGLSGEWETVRFHLDELEGEVDLKYLSHIALEVGEQTTGNKPGSSIVIKDITFYKQKPKPAPPVIIAKNPSPPQPPPQPVTPPALHQANEQTEIVNMLTLVGMGCVLLLGGVLIRKRTGKESDTLPKPWIYATGKPMIPPLATAPPTSVHMIYEINTRSWEAKKKTDGTVKLRCFDRVSSAELKKIKNLGFDTIWLMGIWEISKKAREISRWYADDFYGSPYAIPEYRVNNEIGGEEQFIDFVTRAHKLGLKILVDFVPNHMAVDSRWINEHPEFFVSFPLSHYDSQLEDKKLLEKYPGFYPTYSDSFPEHGRRSRKRIMVAYGKDPNFFPWIDTAQLDYTNPRLRMVMINLLKYWSKIVDGVRCDTVMLVLRDQIKNQWHPHIPWDYFNRIFPEEFWLEAIYETRRINPRFSFVAETYWNKESYLQSLGFDLTYDKNIYDLLASAVNGGDVWNFQQYMRFVTTEYLTKSVHFLENHDEERAMNVFGHEGQKAAATCIMTIPGTPLIHNGQMEGKKERLPVQRIIPKMIEHPDHVLKDFYAQILKLGKHEVFRKGSFYILNTTNSNIFSFFRRWNNETMLVTINLTCHMQTASLHLPLNELKFDAHKKYHFTDLYYPLKSKQVRTRPEVKKKYIYHGSQIIDYGLYVELGPFDSHIFQCE
ncbi:MAG: hypothetical protein GF384_00845 [Elusimicrobia bacterium]|nr:hypothetical protein [Elusimicrobiota bacterium]MBD3411603.1 hypothetical protein [Elusimicrobiota bacterium]